MKMMILDNAKVNERVARLESQSPLIEGKVVSLVDAAEESQAHLVMSLKILGQLNSWSKEERIEATQKMINFLHDIAVQVHSRNN